MVSRCVIRWAAALLAVSLSLTIGVFAFAGPQGWTPLTEAEMAGHRGNMQQRGKFTDTCTHYQAVAGKTGNWSCMGDPDDSDCDKCQVTTNITYADMGGNPLNQKDGASQNCGPTSVGAKCMEQICMGDEWSSTSSCAQPKTSVGQ